MDSDFRPLTARERQLIEKLLEPVFPGCEELRCQLDLTTAAEIDGNGSLALKCDAGPPALVKSRVPTEGECIDTDGLMIYVLLHVVEGKMNELEIFKVGSSTILSAPVPEALLLFAPYSDVEGAIK